MRVTVVATGLGETASAVAPQPEVEIKPVRLVSNDAAEGENVDYNSQDKIENPRGRKKTAKDFVKAATSKDMEYLDIPAFLRRQAD
jgi:cell division protein FtsZ